MLTVFHDFSSGGQIGEHPYLLGRCYRLGNTKKEPNNEPALPTITKSK